MNFQEVQPFLRLGSFLQWAVITLVFLAGFLQIAKFLLDKKVETMREEIASAMVAEYEQKISDLQAHIEIIRHFMKIRSWVHLGCR